MMQKLSSLPPGMGDASSTASKNKVDYREPHLLACLFSAHNLQQWHDVCGGEEVGTQDAVLSARLGTNLEPSKKRHHRPQIHINNSATSLLDCGVYAFSLSCVTTSAGEVYNLSISYF
jgi:hypothetical protein